MSTTTQSKLSVRQMPKRSCVSCRQLIAKNELVRIVQTQDGHVTVDYTAKAPGRGAYICRESTCWELALQKNHLPSALRTHLLPNDRLSLQNYGRRISSVVSEGQS